MTQNCLEIVDWLKSWFTPRDEDYQYEFAVSNHNPTIDSTVQITISVTDGNGAPVTNHSFILDANGTNVSLTTDQNGEATYNYTCSSWGICRFSIKTYACFINIHGWKTYYSDSNYSVRYNQDTVNFTLTYSSNITATTSFKQFGANALVPGSIAPRQNYVFHNPFHNVIFYVSPEGKLYYRSTTGAQVSTNVYLTTSWNY